MSGSGRLRAPDERCARSFVSTGTALALVLVLTSLVQFWPAAHAPALLAAHRAIYRALWPQGWDFFVTEPTRSVVVAYRPDPAGIAVAVGQRQMAARNLWGLSALKSAQDIEVANLAGAIPAGSWSGCTTVAPDQCLRDAAALSPYPARNSAAIPTLCGEVLLAVEDPQRWTSDTAAWLDQWRIQRVVRAVVTCTA